MNNLTKVKYYSKFLVLLLLNLTNVISAKNLQDVQESVYVDHELTFSKEVQTSVQNLATPNTLHLFSHGKPGQLFIEGQWLNAEQLSNWLKTKNLLDRKNTIYIYGCEFAKGDIGKKAIRYIEVILNVSVAASTNITGVGGDWFLEYGNIDQQNALGNIPITLQCADTSPTGDCDGDGVQNNADLDDDNDGILNIDEYGCTFTSITDDLTGSTGTLQTASNVDVSATFGLPANTVTVSATSYNANSSSAFILDNASNTGPRRETNYVINSTIPFIIRLRHGRSIQQNQTDGFVVNSGPSFSASHTLFTGYIETSSGSEYSVQRTPAGGSNGVPAGETFQWDTYVAISSIDITAFTTNTAGSNYSLELCFATDTDGDGIKDYLDLDSDSDGCFDALEGGDSIMASNVQANGTLNGTVDPTTGVPNNVNVNTGQTVGTAQDNLQFDSNGQCDSDFDGVLDESDICQGFYDNVDIDGDNVPDGCDLDDDNDGITDSDEGCSSGLVPGNVLSIPPVGAWEVMVYDGHFEIPNASNTSDRPSTGPDGLPGTPVLSSHGFYIGNTYSFSDITINSDEDPSLSVSASSVILETLVPFTTDNDGQWTLVYKRTIENNGVITIGEPGSYIDDWLELYINGVLVNSIDSNVSSLPAADVITENVSAGDIVELRLSNGFSQGGFDIIIETLNETTLSSICTQDTDGDGFLDHLDLDSDEDGCFDALEANASLDYSDLNTDGTINATVGASADTYPGVPNNSPTTDAGTSQDDTQQVAKCDSCNVNNPLFSDNDGDGVGDDCDIDDDNDGILDAIESPSCFYSEDEFGEGNRTTTITASSDWTYNQGNIQNILNGNNSTNNTTNAVRKYNGDYTFSGQTFLQFEFPVSLEVSEFIIYTEGTIFLESDIIGIIQGSHNGTIWHNITTSGILLDDVSGPYVLNVPTGTPYKFYRLFATSGTIDDDEYLNEVEFTFANFSPSIYPKTSCAEDQDGDSVFNHLDIDSDGDGCSDAFEAGATANDTAGFSFAITQGAGNGDENADGLADAADGNLDGIADYFSTYSNYALNALLIACTDTDNDGVKDLKDIDDDNDGVLDASESPKCFYSETEFGLGDRKSLITVSTDWSYNSGDTQNILDGNNTFNNTTNSVRKTNGDYTFTGDTFLQFKFPGAVEVSEFIFYTEGTVFLDVDITGVVQGSNDGSTWTDLTASGILLDDVAEPYTLTVPTGTPYVYYRLFATGGRIDDNEYLNEVQFTFNNFSASNYQKASCADDTDGDGTVNHLDLDSDNDGCSDSYEAGAITSETTDHQFVFISPANDANGDGLADTVDANQDNVPDYTLLPYAYNINLNLCTDTDNDGVGNLVDIDDDNDGLLDVDECPEPIFQSSFNHSEVAANPAWNSHSYFNSQRPADNYSPLTTNTGTQYLPAMTYAGGWTNVGTVDWSNGPYAAYSSFIEEANVPNGMTITPSSDGGGFAMLSAVDEILSYSFPTVIGETYTIRFEIGTLPFYYTGSRTFVPDFEFGVTGLTPLTEADVISNPISSYPTASVAFATSESNPVVVDPNWQIKEFTFVATANTSELYINLLTDQVQALVLDNVSARKAVDCDIDNDGISNQLDLDSDGDNCPDVREAGFTDSDGDGQLGPATVVVDASGRVISGSDGYTVPIDSDTNGIPDYLEFNDLPTITQQPLNTVVCPGCNTTIISAATGADQYQWQRSNDGGTTWFNLSETGIYSNTQTNALTLTAVTPADNNSQYRVLVSLEKLACSEVVSTEVTVTIQAKSVITNRRITTRVKKN